MLSNIKKITLGILIFLIGITISRNNYVLAEEVEEESNIVNIYLFYSDTCPHCAKEKIFLDDIIKNNDNVRIYKYEINNKDNGYLLDEVASLMDTNVSGVPFTIIGNKFYKGYNEENSPVRFKAAIEYFSKYGYDDIVGKYINNRNNLDIEIPEYDNNIDNDKNEDIPSVDEYAENYNNIRFNLPLIGTVETKNLTLPVIAILIGLVDGFNPCAMWVLLFLISMLIGMKDKKKMFILGITFLLSSSLIYLLFMVAWLNVADLLLSINYVRVGIGIIALIGALVSLIDYFKHRKDNGCSVVDDKKRSKIFNRIKKFTHEKNLLLALIGVVLLACSVNIVELACSAGLPVMFIQILSMNNLTIIEEIIYIGLYMFFFLIDDMIVFFIAVRTMEVTGISTKYGRISKLIGGILLLGIGILMIFKPEWLMFNF